MMLGCKVVNVNTGEVGWVTAILNTGELLRISKRFRGGGVEKLSESDHWEDSWDCLRHQSNDS